ncbi:MAG: hypothetical protein LBU62_09680, partial [Bacteroidales bacterium]|nr:hypothetical protein [Bacteroidales bacterium]
MKMIEEIPICTDCPQKCLTSMRRTGVCCVQCREKCVGKMSCPILDNSKNSLFLQGKSTKLSA